MFGLIAKLLARPRIAAYLIERSQRTPYLHLNGYMNRWWIFNPYDPVSGLRSFKWCPISIRVHHILREDLDRHMHDHPWNARTFILRGWYCEEREIAGIPVSFVRRAGGTARLEFGQFHAIRKVSPGGVFTLFVTSRYQGTWGFKVGGRKIPWRQYLGIK